MPMKTIALLFSMLFLWVQVAGATPASTGNSSRAKTATAQKQTSKYKVRKGDNLYSIAHAHGMKLGEIKRLNGLQDTRLKPGQIILVAGKRKSSSNASRSRATQELSAPLPSLSEMAEKSDEIAGEVGIEPIARSYLSIPYRYGAESRRSTDCSGFTQQVFREFDIALPRTAREQFTVGLKVEKGDLKSGDLLFFRSKKKKYPTHVGIYLGNGKMIHASRSHRKVVISDVNHPYFVKRFLGAKRMAMFLPGVLDMEVLAREVEGIENDMVLQEALPAVQSETTQNADVTASGMAADDEAMATPDPNGDDGEVDNDGDPEPEPEVILQDTHLTVNEPQPFEPDVTFAAGGTQGGGAVARTEP